ncbi:MAG TPA: DUF4402 domain-containing protein [Bacteroidales bacterium]|nr:DUF4402 domain-containing protein [Bacteroidales bacterium]HQH25495.1 DUF4402 domain-containing protein [Bacteroidales bacterium]
MKKLFALSVILIAFTAGAFAQTNQATATATATIVTPITIEATGNLSFGNIVPHASTSGSVTISPDGSASYSTPDIQYSASPTATAARTAAIFTVRGTPGASYSITLPSGNVELNGPNSNTMNAHTFTSDPSINSGQLSNPGGTQTLRVGATLNVTGGQAPGTYTSDNFTVTVNYN